MFRRFRNYPQIGGKRALPYKRRLAYLESTGSQIVDTGFVIKKDTTISLDVAWTFYQSRMFGANGGSGSEVLLSSGSIDRHLLGGAFNAPFPLNTRKNVNIDLTSGAMSMSFDGETVRTAAPSMIVSRGVYLFACHESTSASDGPKNRRWKLWGFSHYTNGVLDMKLIPVMDNDNVPCLYDEANDSLIYNQGTGEFLYGELE